VATYTTDPTAGALAAVRGGTVLLVPVEAADALNDLWAALAEADPTRAVLDRLTTEGLSETPSFALAVRADGEGRVRLVVRGPFSARVDGEVIEGSGVSTWTERVLTGSTVVLEAADVAEAAPDERPAWPIIEGIVHAASVTSTGVESLAEQPTEQRAEPRKPKARPAASQAPSAGPANPAAPSAAAAPATPAAAATSAPAAPAASAAPVVPAAPATPAPATPASADPGKASPPAVEGAVPTVPVVAPVFPPPPAKPAAPVVPAVEPAAPEGVDDATVVVAGRGAASANSSHAGTEQTIIPPPETPSNEAEQGEAQPGGDHDGMTVVGLDLQRLREQRADRAAAAGSPASPSSEKALGLRMPDGSIEPIGHEVVLGRSPSVSQIAGGRLPRVISIGAGDHDISRNHVRVTVEGDTVVVTDLHSRNGTHVAQPGKAPVRLRAGEPTPVLTGSVVDLGGGWTLQVVAI
jgi:hypothetical protein